MFNKKYLAATAFLLAAPTAYVAYANTTVFSLTDHVAGLSGVLDEAALQHPLQRAGGPTVTATDDGLLVSGRTESWHAMDLLRDFSGSPLQVGDTITLSGMIFDAPAGTEMILGGAESPWNWAANTSVEGTEGFTLSLTLTDDHLNDNQFVRFRVQTNGSGQNADFLISQLEVTRDGDAPAAVIPTAPVMPPAPVAPTAPDALYQGAGPGAAAIADVTFTPLFTVNFDEDTFADYLEAGAQMSGEVGTIAGTQAFRLANTTGDFTSGNGNYLNFVLPESIPAGTYVRISWDVWVPASENPDFVPGSMGPGINLNGQFGAGFAQPTNDQDSGRTIALDEWVTTTTEFMVSHELDAAAIDNIIFRFRTNDNVSQPSVLYLDNIVIETGGLADVVTPEWDLSLPSLQALFADHFLVGNIYPTTGIMNQFDTRAAFLHHFNSVTAENWHKPDFIAGPNARSTRPTADEFTFTQADSIMAWAIENDLNLVGHALFWHSQTPNWFFQDEAGQPLTRAQAIDNMHFYVSTLAEHWTANGMIDHIYSWDVFNEAVHSGGGTWSGDLDDWQAGDWRTQMRGNPATGGAGGQSGWWDAFANGYDAAAGEHPSDFIWYAFYFARQYFPNSVLYYNDYNEEIPAKRNAIGQMVEQINARWAEHPSYDGRLLIERIGMQSHYHLRGWTSNFDNVRPAIERFVATGAGVSITELDITITGFGGFTATEAEIPGLIAEQAEAFARLFGYYLEFADHIHRVTLWGLSDTQSWRAVGQPLLFDGQFEAKPAFHAIVDVANNWTSTTPVTAPVTDSQVLLREHVEALGATLTWEPTTRTATVTLDDVTAEFTIGVNAELVNGRSMVQLSQLADLFN